MKKSYKEIVKQHLLLNDAIQLGVIGINNNHDNINSNPKNETTVNVNEYNICIHDVHSHVKAAKSKLFNVFDICDDVWTETIYFLFAKDLINIKQTCTHFNTIFSTNNNNPRLNKLNNFWKMECNRICNTIVQHYKTDDWYKLFVQIFKILKYGDYYHGNIFNSMILKIFKNYKGYPWLSREINPWDTNINSKCGFILLNIYRCGFKIWSDALDSYIDGLKYVQVEEPYYIKYDRYVATQSIKQSDKYICVYDCIHNKNSCMYAYIDIDNDEEMKMFQLSMSRGSDHTNFYRKYVRTSDQCPCEKCNIYQHDYKHDFIECNCGIYKYMLSNDIGMTIELTNGFDVYGFDLQLIDLICWYDTLSLLKMLLLHPKYDIFHVFELKSASIETLTLFFHYSALYGSIHVFKYLFDNYTDSIKLEYNIHGPKKYILFVAKLGGNNQIFNMVINHILQQNWQNNEYYDA